MSSGVSVQDSEKQMEADRSFRNSSVNGVSENQDLVARSRKSVLCPQCDLCADTHSGKVCSGTPCSLRHFEA